MNGRVLIVEDDPDIQSVLSFNLERAGFETVVTDRGASAIRIVREEPVDLVLLDVMLPDIPGFDVCREIRSGQVSSQVLVLMLTARGQEPDRLQGFESGADDYIVKPFSTRELVLRVRALMRRGDKVTPLRRGEFAHGGLTIDEKAHRVFVASEEVRLTSIEFKLLSQFATRPGVVLTRPQLLSDVWNMQGELMTRTVDTHVKRLREKLGPAGKFIETVRAVGYRFDPGAGM